MTQNLSEEDYYTKVDRRLHIKWTAPEVVFYKKYSTSSDVWSYGMLMYEIWSLGHRPFGESQPRQVIAICGTAEVVVDVIVYIIIWIRSACTLAVKSLTLPTELNALLTGSHVSADDAGC